MICSYAMVGAPMPKSPERGKRPAEVIGNAVRLVRIATSEETERLSGDESKDPAAQPGIDAFNQSPSLRIPSNSQAVSERTSALSVPEFGQ